MKAAAWPRTPLLHAMRCPAYPMCWREATRLWGDFHARGAVGYRGGCRRLPCSHFTAAEADNDIQRAIMASLKTQEDSSDPNDLRRSQNLYVRPVTPVRCAIPSAPTGAPAVRLCPMWSRINRSPEALLRGAPPMPHPSSRAHDWGATGDRVCEMTASQKGTRPLVLLMVPRSATTTAPVGIKPQPLPLTRWHSSQAGGACQRGQHLLFQFLAAAVFLNPGIPAGNPLARRRAQGSDARNSLPLPYPCCC